jgi:WD40 repeat protein
MSRYQTTLSVIVFMVAIVVSSRHVSLAQQNFPDRVRAIAWSPDGTKIASSNNRGQTQILDANTSQLLRTLQSDTTGATIALDWNLSSTQIATAGFDGRIKIWDVGTGQLINNLQSSPNFGTATSVNWSTDGTKIALAGESGAIAIWNTSNSQIIASFGSQSDLNNFAWSPDSTQLAIAASVEVRIINATTGTTVRTMLGHSGMVTDVVWRSPDLLISTGFDGTIRRWNSSTGQEVGNLAAHTPYISVMDLDINPSSSIIATVGFEDTSLKLTSVTPLEVIRTVQANAHLNAVSWSPDGNRIAYGGDTNQVVVTSFAGSGRGLRGTYYALNNLTGLRFFRLSNQINFN